MCANPRPSESLWLMTPCTISKTSAWFRILVHWNFGIIWEYFSMIKHLLYLQLEKQFSNIGNLGPKLIIINWEKLQIWLFITCGSAKKSKKYFMMPVIFQSYEIQLLCLNHYSIIWKPSPRNSIKLTPWVSHISSVTPFKSKNRDIVGVDRWKMVR